MQANVVRRVATESKGPALNGTHSGEGSAHHPPRTFEHSARGIRRMARITRRAGASRRMAAAGPSAGPRTHPASLRRGAA